MISPKLLPVVFLLLTALLVPFASGCASRDGKTYSDGDVRKVQRVSVGTVVDVTEVMVEDDPSLVGPIIGGVAGGVVGSLFGAGAGKTLATLGGAAIGAVAGGVERFRDCAKSPGARTHTGADASTGFER